MRIMRLLPREVEVCSIQLRPASTLSVSTMIAYLHEGDEQQAKVAERWEQYIK